jgi:hypothetical protein
MYSVNHLRQLIVNVYLFWYTWYTYSSNLKYA